MSKKIKFVKLLSSVALSTMFLGMVGNETFAASEDSKNFEGTAVAAYYYVDGKKIEIPKEDLSELLDTNSVYDLPYEPINTDEYSTINQKVKDINKISPLAVQCVAGYTYDARKVSGAFENKASGSRIANKTSKNLTKTSTIAGTLNIGGEVSADGSFDWKIINAKVGFKINGSYSWYTSEATAVTVPPNRMGWNDYGSYKEKWTGNYYYLTSSCGKTGVINVTPKGPKYKLDVARESAIPPGV